MILLLSTFISGISFIGTIPPSSSASFLILDLESLANFVATDAHKLIRHTINESSNKTTSFILPKKPLNIIKNIFSEFSEDIEISYDKSNAIFSYKDLIIYCRLVEGSYPNYEQVIPKDNSNELIISKKNLISALKKVMPLSNKSTNQVVFDIKGILGDKADYRL